MKKIKLTKIDRIKLLAAIIWVSIWIVYGIYSNNRTNRDYIFPKINNGNGMIPVTCYNEGDEVYQTDYMFWIKDDENKYVSYGIELNSYNGDVKGFIKGDADIASLLRAETKSAIIDRIQKCTHLYLENISSNGGEKGCYKRYYYLGDTSWKGEDYKAFIFYFWDREEKANYLQIILYQDESIITDRMIKDIGTYTPL